MLDNDSIVRIVHEAAAKSLPAGSIERVLTEPATDSEGRDALRITIVVHPTAPDALTGDAVLDTLVSIHHQLLAEGEERFPIVEYTTPEELEDVGDSQS